MYLVVHSDLALTSFHLTTCMVYSGTMHPAKHQRGNFCTDRPKLRLCEPFSWCWGGKVSLASALALEAVIQPHQKYQTCTKDKLHFHPMCAAIVSQWWQEFFCSVPSAVKEWGGWCYREMGWGSSWMGQIWRGSRVYKATLDVIYILYELKALFTTREDFLKRRASGEHL